MTILDGASPPAADLVKDGTDQGFMADVIEASRAQPVIVDFWAPWCGPCRQLGPPLEKAVRAAAGKVKLVKINIDEHPGVAGQLGVRSIPAVYAFDQGRPVDGFMGVDPRKPDQALRRPPRRRQHGAGHRAAARAGRREPAARRRRRRGAILRRRAAARSGQRQGHRRHGARLSHHRRRRTGARGARHAAAGERPTIPTSPACAPRSISPPTPSEAGDSGELDAKVAANPNDLQARYDLAEALSARGDLEGASEHLLAIIAKDRDWNEDAARKQLLKIFDAAGPGLRRRQAGTPQAVGDSVLVSAFGYRKPGDLPQTLALFPLAGAILLPRGVMALNVFEPRYLNMVDDALGGERLIGMIQPAGGEDERSRTRALADVGTVGRITAFNETDDGRYLITLTGVCRFDLEQELEAGTPYRQAIVNYDAVRRRLHRLARAQHRPRRPDRVAQDLRGAARLPGRLGFGRAGADRNHRQRRRPDLSVRSRRQAGAARSAHAGGARQDADGAARMGRRLRRSAEADAMSEPDPKLLEVLVCPQTRTPLRYDRERQELVSERARLAYPVRDGVPIMLIDEARELGPDE